MTLERGEARFSLDLDDPTHRRIFAGPVGAPETGEFASLQRPVHRLNRASQNEAVTEKTTVASEIDSPSSVAKLGRRSAASASEISVST